MSRLRPKVKQSLKSAFESAGPRSQEIHTSFPSKSILVIPGPKGSENSCHSCQGPFCAMRADGIEPSKCGKRSEGWSPKIVAAAFAIDICLLSLTWSR